MGETPALSRKMTMLRYTRVGHSEESLTAGLSCIRSILQNRTAAVQAALNSFNKVLLERHIKSCGIT